jgi:hypothetical protein
MSGSKWEEMDGKGKLRRVSAKECELDRVSLGWCGWEEIREIS